MSNDVDILSLNEKINILKQKAAEQINIDEIKSLSLIQRLEIIEKFIDNNAELFADILVENLTKDLVNVKDLAVGDQNIFYVEGSEDVNQKNGQEE